MRDHPLTPMRDANLVRVLQRQSRGGSAWCRSRQSNRACRPCVPLSRSPGPRLSLPRRRCGARQDLRVIGEACTNMKLVTGGSGIAMGLPDNFRRPAAIGRNATARLRAPAGRPVILAGSCSAATRDQVRHASGPVTSFADRCTRRRRWHVAAPAVVDWVMAHTGERPALVYSSAARQGADRAGEARARPRRGRRRTSARRCRARLLERGFSRFVIAGGETPGAVVDALGAKALEIGPEIAPGVPWTRLSIGTPDGARPEIRQFRRPRLLPACFSAYPLWLMLDLCRHCDRSEAFSCNQRLNGRDCFNSYGCSMTGNVLGGGIVGAEREAICASAPRCLPAA